MAKVMLQSSALPSIQILTGPDKGAFIPLNSPILTIGRSDENDIVVNSDGVSRIHAKVMTTEAGVVIRDNGSKNGVVVNGNRQTEVALKEGDIVQIGDFAFRFALPSAVGEEPGVSVEALEVVTPVVEEEAPKRRRSAAPPNRRVLLYSVLALFLGAALYFGKGDEPAKKDEKPE